MSDCRVCGAKCPGWFMCGLCAGEVERCIAEMPSLMHELSNVATGQTNVYRASGKPQSDLERFYDPEASITPWLRSRDGRVALRPTRLMVRLDVQELAWVAGNTLTSWARHLAESRGGDLPTLQGAVRRRLYVEKNRMHVWTRQFPDMHIDPLIGWLLRHINSMRLDEAADEIHDEITTLHAQMERSVDRSPSRLFAGPCHAEVSEPDVNERDGTVYVSVRFGKCQRDVYAWPGADTVKCDGFRGDGEGCGTVHTAVDRRDWLLDSVEDALLPLEVLRVALPKLLPDAPDVAKATWRSWRLRGQLAAKSVDRNAVELFRGGDVIRLVTDDAVRRGPRRERRAG